MRALFGMETEYAVSGVIGGMPVGRDVLLRGLMRLARRRPHLPDGESGIFLENGARLYVDHGRHPELATPECGHPDELVRYAMAGDAFLAGLLDAMAVPGKVDAEVLLTKCNVDYSGSRATWGCHESYLHRKPDWDFSEDLLPHLVSRIIFAGAGGFDPLSAGIEFSLSPRAAFFTKVGSTSSTSGRGLFHPKQESLASPGYGRLHVIFGEGLCSQKATWLKVGTTALVVAMIEAGVRPGRKMRLKAPIEAVRRFARDPGTSCRVPLAAGGLTGAVEIQRHYLREVERLAGTSRLPDWAEEVCREWRVILEGLSDGPACFDRTLDWAIKRRVYGQRLLSRGFTWEELDRWNPVLIALRPLVSNLEGSRGFAAIFGRNSPVRSQVRALKQRAERDGLNWKRLEPLLLLRRELFEIDTRFAQLGTVGIFAALDRSGTLSHRVIAAQEVESAQSMPPATNRAAARAAAVWRLATEGQRYRCDWTGIRDLEKGRLLDLSDPFRTFAAWRKVPDPAGKKEAEDLLRSRLAVALGSAGGGGGSDD